MREVLVDHERNRFILPEVNASLCYGLSSVAKIAEQLGLEKTHVRVQHSMNENRQDEKSPVGFGKGGPFEKPSGSAIGVVQLKLDDPKALKTVMKH
jgi:hypothetical protein